MGSREQAIAALEKVRAQVGDVLIQGMEVNQLIIRERLLVPKLDLDDAEILLRTANLTLIDMRAKARAA